MSLQIPDERKLKNMNRDRIQTVTKIAATAGGAAAGAAAAPTAAGIAGATTIPIVTKVAAVVGLKILAATPVGWVVGGVLVGGLAVRGVLKLIENGAEAEAERAAHEQAKRKKSEQDARIKRAAAVSGERFRSLEKCVQEAVSSGRCQRDQASRLLREVRQGSVSFGDANRLLELPLATAITAM